MTQPIRGEVTRLLNNREIEINIGSNHGVTIGMYFDVMDVNEIDIIDPDTNELLGSIERPVVRMKITHIQKKLSVASTYKVKLINVRETATGSTSILNTTDYLDPRWIKEYETLEDTEETKAPLDEEKSKVKTGYSVVQVFDIDQVEKEDIG